jgi:hypothetical protein
MIPRNSVVVSRGLVRSLGLAATILSLAACGKRPERIPSGSDPKAVSRAGVDLTGDAKNANPHGAANPHGTTNPHGTPSAATTPVDGSAGSSSSFAWTTPPGWTELPSTSMRTANFRPAGDPHAECYLTFLVGDAGGLGANVNRWRAQLSLPPLTGTEIDALPKAAFLGRGAALLEGTGTWKGMNGGESAPGWGLLGLLLVDPNGSAFLKMTGPAKTVAAEREAFLALAKSFRAAGAPEPKASDASPKASDVDAKANGSESSKPADSAPAPHPKSGDANASGLSWTLPDGWRTAPEKPMRAASFFAGPGESVECYVSIFPGEAGGLLANVNRWRGQLDLPELTGVDCEHLESFPMLGRRGVVVEIEGKGTKLVGAACTGSDHSVFVKMTGPPELVREQRGAFLAFCMSLGETK